MSTIAIDANLHCYGGFECEVLPLTAHEYNSNRWQCTLLFAMMASIIKHYH